MAQRSEVFFAKRYVRQDYVSARALTDDIAKLLNGLEPTEIENIEIIIKKPSSGGKKRDEPLGMLKALTGSYIVHEFVDAVTNTSMNFKTHEYVYHGSNVYLTPSEELAVFRVLVLNDYGPTTYQPIRNARKRLGEAFLGEYISKTRKR